MVTVQIPEHESLESMADWLHAWMPGQGARWDIRWRSDSPGWRIVFYSDADASWFELLRSANPTMAS